MMGITSEEQDKSLVELLLNASRQQSDKDLGDLLFAAGSYINQLELQQNNTKVVNADQKLAYVMGMISAGLPCGCCLPDDTIEKMDAYFEKIEGAENVSST